MIKLRVEPIECFLQEVTTDRGLIGDNHIANGSLWVTWSAYLGVSTPNRRRFFIRASGKHNFVERSLPTRAR